MLIMFVSSVPSRSHLAKAFCRGGATLVKNSSCRDITISCLLRFVVVSTVIFTRNCSYMVAGA